MECGAAGEMNRYAVMSIYCLNRRGNEPHYTSPIDLDMYGAFEKVEDAIECYNENDADVIIDCVDGVLVDTDDGDSTGTSMSIVCGE